MILFTADWHIKLGQKNVPVEWAKKRYHSFFDQVHEQVKTCDMHIIGGDLFDRIPNMEELALYFSFVRNVKKPTLIFDGNHEATHVTPEVDLDRFDPFPVVFAGDLHAHSNTQRNIVYPGSPMTTAFHRQEVDTGYLLINPKDWSWEWWPFTLPQLIRKTVTNPEDMIPTTYHHTIYEIEGNIQELAAVENSELLDKKVVRRTTEASLVLD